MNLEKDLQHNIDCWNEDILSIDNKIASLKGKRDQIEQTVETLELIIKNNKTTPDRESEEAH
ncbi:MAG: hypothetical protein WA775_02930 [Psychroserpens sp.]|uniref:hypothetical protein n=1 Tax=Psychroserpens sp. TaxID=2020870 RepID=UPI003C8EF48D